MARQIVILGTSYQVPANTVWLFTSCPTNYGYGSQKPPYTVPDGKWFMLTDIWTWDKDLWYWGSGHRNSGIYIEGLPPVGTSQGGKINLRTPMPIPPGTVFAGGDSAFVNNSPEEQNMEVLIIGYLTDSRDDF